MVESDEDQYRLKWRMRWICMRAKRELRSTMKMDTCGLERSDVSLVTEARDQ